MTSRDGFQRLDQSELRLAEDQPDIRGWPAIDSDGVDIGKVTQLYVDVEDRRVRLVHVRGGGIFGIGDTDHLIPVEAIDRLEDDRVILGRDATHVARGPRYDPKLIEDRAYVSGLYLWYGYGPYWGMPPVIRDPGEEEVADETPREAAKAHRQSRDGGSSGGAHM